jgi:hypothetical protein
MLVTIPSFALQGIDAVRCDVEVSLLPKHEVKLEVPLSAYQVCLSVYWMSASTRWYRPPVQPWS